MKILFVLLLVVSFPVLSAQEKDSITLIVKDSGSFNDLRAIVSTYSDCSIQTGVYIDHITLDGQCEKFSSYSRSLSISDSQVPVVFSVDDGLGTPIEGECRLVSIDSTGNKTRYTLECRDPLHP